MHLCTVLWNKTLFFLLGLLLLNFVFYFVLSQSHFLTSMYLHVKFRINIYYGWQFLKIFYYIYPDQYLKKSYIIQFRFFLHIIAVKIVGIRLVGLHIHVVKPQSLKINKSAKNLQKRWIENHSYCIQYSRSISLSLSASCVL